MKKFLILTVSVLFVSCPVGPSIPTEALFCITGKTKGTARIEAVGGNEAAAGFGKTFVFKESFTLSFFLRLRTEAVGNGGLRRSRAVSAGAVAPGRPVLRDTSPIRGGRRAFPIRFFLIY